MCVEFFFDASGVVKYPSFFVNTRVIQEKISCQEYKAPFNKKGRAISDSAIFFLCYFDAIIFFPESRTN